MKTQTLVEVLRRKVRDSSAAEVARELEISEAMVSRILAGERNPGRKIARALGYEAVTVFRAR